VTAYYVVHDSFYKDLDIYGTENIDFLLISIYMWVFRTKHNFEKDVSCFNKNQ